MCGGVYRGSLDSLQWLLHAGAGADVAEAHADRVGGLDDRPGERLLLLLQVHCREGPETEIAATTSPDEPRIGAATHARPSAPLIAELSELDGVASVKVETQPTAPKLGAVVEATGDGFLVLGGQNAPFVLEEYARGAVGTMPASEFPDLLRPVPAAQTAGDHPAARAEFNRLLPQPRINVDQSAAAGR